MERARTVGREQYRSQHGGLRSGRRGDQVREGARLGPPHALQEHARDRDGHQEDGPAGGEEVPRGGHRHAPLHRLPPLLRRRRPHRAGEERGLYQRPGPLAQEVRGDAPQHPEERRVQRGGTRGIEAAHGSDAGFFLEARGRSKRAGERPRRAPRGRSRGEEPLLSARPNDATAARVRASRRRRAAFAVGIATHHARVFDAFSVFRDCEGHSKNTLSPQKKFAKRDRLTLSSLPSSLASSPFTHDRSRVLTPRRSPCTTSR